MKALLIPLLLSFSSLAYSSKPELLARYSGIDSFNAPEGLYCFGSEPQPTREGVFLGCQTADGYLMMKWNPNYQVVASSAYGMFSHPRVIQGKAYWYEFSEAGVKSLYEYQHQKLQVIELKDLGSIFSLVDSFVAVKNHAYVYRLQDESKKLQLWSNHEVSSLFAQEIGYIFPPSPDSEGNFVVKMRSTHTGENAPDELLIWDGDFKSVLKDRDADSASPFKAFRHQHALADGKVAVVVTDDEGEALYLIAGENKTLVARAGKELMSFDYFSPKMRAGVLVFRGVDLNKRKAVYKYEEGKLTTLITQGDVVQTDKGLARVDYQDQDALFYGAPGIGPTGDIYLQATLTDIDSPSTLLGIGLLRFQRE